MAQVASFHHRRGIREGPPPSFPAPSTLEQVQAVAQKELEDETVDVFPAPAVPAFRRARYGYDPGAHQHQPPQVRAGGAGPQGQRPGNDPLGAHRQGCTGVYVTG